MGKKEIIKKLEELLNDSAENTIQQKLENFINELKKSKKLNISRIVFALIYLFISIALLLFFRNKIFYFEVLKANWNIPRFVWCCSFISLGFATTAFILRYHEKSPFPEYITHYPIQLLAMASLIFSALHVFDATSGYLFYYLSFSLCFTMGFMVDQYWSFIKSIIGKFSK